MDIPKPAGGDDNLGTGIFAACWALTAIVGLVLLFRFSVKAWICKVLPKVASTERVWGLEDFFFFFAYLCDILEMAFLQESYQWGLGRHFYYLTPLDRNQAMRFDFASQPPAIASPMLARTGMMWFLYQCFAVNNRRLRPVIIACMTIQIIVSLFAILQIVLQCGPNPYRPADRTAYFHYLWDSLPEDGSVICQDPTVQADVGFVQGAINTVIDFFLAYISAVEVWQHLFKTMDDSTNVSFIAQYRKMNPTVRSRRIWQTVILSGPLVVSGIASIVKTVLLKSIGERLDFTYNIVTFLLWVKIENYSILIAASAPIGRTFFHTFIEKRRKPDNYGSRSGNAIELENSKKSTTNSSNKFHRIESQEDLIDDSGPYISPDSKNNPSLPENGLSNGVVRIETDIEVCIDREMARDGKDLDPTMTISANRPAGRKP